MNKIFLIFSFLASTCLLGTVFASVDKNITPTAVHRPYRKALALGLASAMFAWGAAKTTQSVIKFTGMGLLKGITTCALGVVSFCAIEAFGGKPLFITNKRFPGYAEQIRKERASYEKTDLHLTPAHDRDALHGIFESIGVNVLKKTMYWSFR